MDIYQYIKEHSTPQGEALDWLERQTNIRTNHSRMLSGAVQGRFLMMLTEMIAPRRVLELGTFTGYSAICLASRLPEGGHLDTLEINDELEDLILEGFERAGVSDRITLHMGDCKQTLLRLRDSISQPTDPAAASTASSCGQPGQPAAAPYDLVYIDANKREYVEYYNLVFDMVRPGGYILADNVLWDGKVCMDDLPTDRQTQGVSHFNDLIASDPRVEVVILPLRDGLSLIRRLP